MRTESKAIPKLSRFAQNVLAFLYPAKTLTAEGVSANEMAQDFWTWGDTHGCDTAGELAKRCRSVLAAAGELGHAAAQQTGDPGALVVIHRRELPRYRRRKVPMGEQLGYCLSPAGYRWALSVLADWEG